MAIRENVWIFKQGASLKFKKKEQVKKKKKKHKKNKP